MRAVSRSETNSEPLMDITRFGRGLMHAAISGEYGEALIRLELSRAGWPLVLSCRGVAIDILAVAPSRCHRIGITVKCRDRGTQNPNESTYIFREKPGKRAATDEIVRFRDICKLLEAEPWIAVVTIKPEFCYSHLTSLQNYEEKYASKSRNKAWNNTPKWLALYAADPAVLGNKKQGAKGIWTL
jgi:hypothetical protein